MRCVGGGRPRATLDCSSPASPPACVGPRQCDVTPNGYGLGQRSHAIAGEYGLCPTTNGTSCTQCILWQTNYACEPFARCDAPQGRGLRKQCPANTANRAYHLTSPWNTRVCCSAQESFVEFGSGWSPEVVSGSSTPSVVTLVTRTQFQQAVGHGGDYVVATVEGDDSSLLSWSVRTRAVARTAPGGQGNGHDSDSLRAPLRLVSVCGGRCTTTKMARTICPSPPPQACKSAPPTRST